MAIVSTARNLFLFWTFVQEVAAAGGRGGARGVGGNLIKFIFCERIR
jgi:hypothetical protein